MRALTLKLIRETWKQRGQMLSIGAVVAVAIMTVLTMRGAYVSLTESQTLYYRDTNFPDIWVSLQRAPEPLHADLEEIDGVETVETRITFTANISVPGLDEPALGRLVSIPVQQRRMLAGLSIQSGGYLTGARDEVIVSKNFALANGFEPGDRFQAIINGHQRSLRIVGTAISPEHIYTIPPGALFPDDERYGILWMARSELAPAYNMDGAFNEVLLTLAPGADPDRVIAELDRLLRPYGGLGAYPRSEQLSHQILQSELDSVQAMGTTIPVIFLGVAAFLLNLVLGRMIAVQRTEIAVLKAFGYSNLQVGVHYLQFAMVAVFAGAIVGIGVGIWLGGGMVQLYGEYFDFPNLRYSLDPSLILIAVGVSALAATLGAIGAVRRAVSLPPAEAMRPEPPATFRPGITERIGLGRALPAATRMILRNMERQPVRSLFSVAGVGFAVAILVIGMFMFDGVEHMLDLQFRVAQREDLTVAFNRPLPVRAEFDLARLEGVTQVEPFRMVPARLRVAHLEKETAVTGLPLDGQLRQITTTDGDIRPLPPEGIVMSDLLAGDLGLQTGDTLDIEFLEGERRNAKVTLAGIVEDYVGVAVYTEIENLHRMTGSGRAISGAYLTVDPDRLDDLNAELKHVPAIASVASRLHMLESFEEELEESLFISVFFILGFSLVIAVAVIYNGARVALSERGRELASLRVLGFTRFEVAVLLLGEQGLTTLAAIPIGCVLGFVLSAALAAGIATETYRIPIVITPQTYAIAGIITILAALASGWIVRRRLDRMNLIDVLKTRE